MIKSLMWKVFAFHRLHTSEVNWLILATKNPERAEMQDLLYGLDQFDFQTQLAQREINFTNQLNEPT